MDTIHLIGAGGHGRVVADALVAGGTDPDAILFRDGRAGLFVAGRAVVVPEVDASLAGAHFHVAVGSATIRRRLYAAACEFGARPLTVVHPAAVVAQSAQSGRAALIAANAVLAPGAILGNGTIVNHGAIVDHDTRVGAFCHIAPHATLGGGVVIGDRVMVGAGAVVLPGVTVADDVTIGAGSVVLRSIDQAGTWVGNPARKLNA